MPFILQPPRSRGRAELCPLLYMEFGRDQRATARVGRGLRSRPSVLWRRAGRFERARWFVRRLLRRGRCRGNRNFRGRRRDTVWPRHEPRALADEMAKRIEIMIGEFVERWHSARF